jgi:hypothetical protein
MRFNLSCQYTTSAATSLTLPQTPHYLRTSVKPTIALYSSGTTRSWHFKISKPFSKKELGDHRSHEALRRRYHVIDCAMLDPDRAHQVSASFSASASASLAVPLIPHTKAQQTAPRPQGKFVAKKTPAAKKARRTGDPYPKPAEKSTSTSIHLGANSALSSPKSSTSATVNPKQQIGKTSSSNTHPPRIHNPNFPGVNPWK